MNEKEFISELANAKSKNPIKSKDIILAYKQHIYLAIQNGYTRKDIFDLLQKKGIYPYTYDAFIKAFKIVMNTNPMISNNGNPSSTPNDDASNAKKKKPTGFEFNPKVKDTSELI